MKELKPISEDFNAPIASRDFEFVEDGLSTSGILVEIGTPIRDVETVDGVDWRCPVRFSGEKLARVSYACGVDSFQSLSLALQLVRSELERLETELGGRIRFLESDSPLTVYCEPLRHGSKADDTL